jgi:hypothetical protein
LRGHANSRPGFFKVKRVFGIFTLKSISQAA